MRYALVMTVAYFTHPLSLKHEMGDDHPECPDRVRVIDDYLRAHGLLDFLLPVTPEPAPLEAILRAHGKQLVAELEHSSPIQGYMPLDGDTTMNPFTYEAALHAAGAAVNAVDMVMRGDVSRAFCNVRPPGHHAERNQAMGFCFFNNAAIAVLHALEAHGLKRVALVDFDVHHGNGSEDILAKDCDAGRALMVSTFQHSIYPGSGTSPLSAKMVNVPLDPYSKGDAMRAAVTNDWIPALDLFKPELLVISAGFDAHRDDPLAMLGWNDDDYRWVTQTLVAVADRHCKGRIVSTLEGGYDLHALARCAGEHVKVLLGAAD